MKIYQYNKNLFYSLAWLFLCSTLLTACTVTLLSNYNPDLVKELTSLQKQLNTLLITVQNNVGTKKATYAPYKKTYDAIEVNLISLVTQLKAIPNNDITLKQVQILQAAINNIKTLHQRGFKSVQQVLLVRQTLNDDFLALFKLQYAKKTLLGTHPIQP